MEVNFKLKEYTIIYIKIVMIYFWKEKEKNFKMENKNKIALLLEKYNNGTITEEETELLATLVDIDEFNNFADEIEKDLFNDYGE